MTRTPENSHALVPGTRRRPPLPSSMRTGYGEKIPAVFLRSPDGGKRFWEFFTANIRNRHTRRAYFVAVSQFSAWCEKHKLSLEHCPLALPLFLRARSQNREHHALEDETPRPLPFHRQAAAAAHLAAL